MFSFYESASLISSLVFMRYFNRVCLNKPSCRSIGYLSPDRNRAEQIRDRQNTFRWNKHHIFRPHQHFTYDPASWSREWREKDKAIPLIMQEKYDIEHSKGLEIVEENDSLLSDIPINAFMQKQVRRIESLQDILFSPRHRGTITEKRKEQLREQIKVAVLDLYNKICNISKCASISLSSRICVWDILLEHADILLFNAYNESGLIVLNSEGLQSSLSTDEMAIQSNDSSAIYSHLKKSLLCCTSMTFQFSDKSPEICIDFCSILLHPIVQNCLNKYETDDSELYAFRSEKGIRFIISGTTEVMRNRLLQVKCTGEGAAEEVFPPHAVKSWSLVIQRYISTFYKTLLDEKRFVENLLLHVSLVTARSAATLLYLLKRSLPEQNHLYESLVSTSAQNKNQGRKLYSSTNVLTVGSTPLGIQKPLTNSSDVSLILESTINMCSTVSLCDENHLLNLMDDLTQESNPLKNSLINCFYSVFDLLTFAPNYDIEPSLLVELCIRWLESPLSSLSIGTNESHFQQYQIVVLQLLSRIRIDHSMSSFNLYKLCLLLAESYTFSPAFEVNQEWLSECRRLRGITMKNIFSTVAADDFLKYDNLYPVPCIVRLNNARVNVPYCFWKRICQLSGVWRNTTSFLKVSGKGISRETAVALLQVRERCRDGVVDLPNVLCIAHCLEKILCNPNLEHKLLTIVTTWDNVIQHAPLHNLQLYKECKQFVANIQFDHATTVSFD